MRVAVPTLKEQNHDGKTGWAAPAYRDGASAAYEKKEGYQMWQIHEDMKRTLQQEQALTEENQRLKDRKEQLISPDAVEKQAREQFGLAEPGEIPYRR